LRPIGVPKEIERKLTAVICVKRSSALRRVQMVCEFELYWPLVINCRKPSMRGVLIAALSVLVTLSGCVQPQPRSRIAAPTREVPPTPAATTASPVAADTGKSPTAVPPALPKEKASAPQSSSQPPTAGSPLKATASSPEESRIPAKPPVAVTTPVEPLASPALDLAGLEQRLRDTHAIGVFTKLSLKNQVDDLLDQFRGFYQGQIKVPLAELRQRYELLLLKVLTLLQDTDQQLANAIASSREAIWGILADPQKFAKI
jgi:hypothetical protein